MTRIFQIAFGQQVVRNIQQNSSRGGRKTCSMRYAKSTPIVFRFLPGLLLLVIEFLAPEYLNTRRSNVPTGSRDGGNTTYTLHTRKVVFSSRCLCSLPSTSIKIFSHTPTALVLDEASSPRRGKLRVSVVNATITTARTAAARLS